MIRHKVSDSNSRELNALIVSQQWRVVDNRDMAEVERSLEARIEVLVNRIVQLTNQLLGSPQDGPEIK